jgi:hypothetical protein
VIGLSDGEFRPGLVGEYNSRAKHIGIALGGTGSRGGSTQGALRLDGSGKEK